jgi:hypothetical protein
MAHGLVKATIMPELIRLIMENYSVNEEKALDMFYTSATAASLGDDETSLYGQSPLNIVIPCSVGTNWRTRLPSSPA